MYTSDLPIWCLCITCVPAVFGGQKRELDPWNWNYRWLWATVSVLGMDQWSLEEQPVLLTAEPAFPLNSIISQMGKDTVFKIVQHEWKLEKKKKKRSGMTGLNSDWIKILNSVFGIFYQHRLSWASLLILFLWGVSLSSSSLPFWFSKTRSLYGALAMLASSLTQRSTCLWALGIKVWPPHLAFHNLIKPHFIPILQLQKQTQRPKKLYSGAFVFNPSQSFPLKYCFKKVMGVLDHLW